MRRFYRDRENGIFLGVCAGLADALGFKTGVLRVITAIALLCWFWPVAIVYLVAGVLMRDRPLRFRGSSREEYFWRNHDDRYHSGR